MILQTLHDVKKSLDPDGNPAAVIDMLTERNDILDDMVWKEGNELTGETTTRVVSAPIVYDVAYNEGAKESKSGKEQVTEAFGMMEGNSFVDTKVADMMPNRDAWRAGEDRQFVTALNKRLAHNVMYGNRTLYPKQFTGFDPRLNTPSEDSDNSGYNMIDGGGVGSDNMSIWLIGWSPDTVHMGYPKNSQAGLTIKNRGVVLSSDSNGNPLWVHATNFLWNVGLVVRDWRYVVRICNVDRSNLTKDASGGADLIDLMTIAVEVLESTVGVNPVFYMNKAAKTYLNRQATSKIGSTILSYEDIFQRRRVLTLQGVPVRVVEQLTDAEAKISGSFAW